VQLGGSATPDFRLQSQLAMECLSLAPIAEWTYSQFVYEDPAGTASHFDIFEVSEVKAIDLEQLRQLKAADDKRKQVMRAMRRAAGKQAWQPERKRKRGDGAKGAGRGRARGRGRGRQGPALDTVEQALNPEAESSSDGEDAETDDEVKDNWKEAVDQARRRARELHKRAQAESDELRIDKLGYIYKGKRTIARLARMAPKASGQLSWQVSCYCSAPKHKQCSKWGTGQLADELVLDWASRAVDFADSTKHMHEFNRLRAAALSAA